MMPIVDKVHKHVLPDDTFEVYYKLVYSRLYLSTYTPLYTKESAL
jgi:hypothetical protein